ncbi:CD3324 family protein [Lederbergia sp. NSJ-179]|uniref:CD3324 family protein n=1 Tax=Lederbergia sp. NSJ-179 TaxID=2931402 RepID=UPI001FD36FDE|nr:CD3324 family protein [Lederbergia sp. NSJ-179]MCJ7841017.1 CD3324 family protein [Lederbergia sp. NSJ-179]
MKYMKAHAVFPKDLLKEIQKYVQGEMVYIPNAEGVRKKWGENSGYREFLKQRNVEIRQQFSEGISIDQLTVQYSLSYDSIKKIVYSKK